MSERKYTRTVEVDIELCGDELVLRFNNAQVEEWREPLGPIADYYSRDDIENEIQHQIEDYSADLAYSLAEDLFDRIVEGEV